MGRMNTTTDDEQEDDASPDAIVKRVKKHRKDSDEALGDWREEARECYAFVAGDQWSAEDKAKLEEMMRVPTVFNRIGPMVDSVSGSEINNRQQVQYIPRQPGQSGVNELLSGAADYFRENCDADDEESDAFLDAVICGVGVTETALDYIDNPEGMVKIERRDPLSMRWDPTAKKRNLSDKKWAQRDEWMTRDEIEEKWPEKADEIGESFVSAGADLGDKTPVDNRLAFLYASDNKGGYDSKTGRMLVIHEQWYELETFYKLIDPTSGQIVEMDDDKYQTLEPRMKAMGITLQSVKRQRKVWKQAFVAGDVLLEESDVPCAECSWKFITGKRDRNNNTWFGIVKAMLDPQRWANKFFSQLLHIINTNAKGGLIVEKGAVENLRKFREEWAKADGVTVVNEGGMDKIRDKQPPAVPPQINQLLEFSISSLRDVTGINLEMLGMADRQQAGVLEAQRKQSALTVLAAMFDALRRYRKEQGRLLAKFITEYLSDGRLVRIAGGNGSEKYIPLLRDPQSLEYDVVVDEMPNTVNQKERTFGVLMQLLPNLAQMGVPFGPELLEYTPLPTAMVEKWRAQMEQAKQQPKPPDPNQIKAQATVTSAQASMLNAQAHMVTAQAHQTNAQGNQMKNAADAQNSPMQTYLDQQKLAVDARKADADNIAAEADRIHAMAAYDQAQASRLGLTPVMGNGNGSAMPG